MDLLFAPRCGYCLEASMTGRGDGVGVFRFLALLGMTRWQCFVVFTLAPVSGTGTGFDPLPLRERGNMVGVVLLYARPPPLWIADQVRNDRPGRFGLLSASPCGFPPMRE